MKVSVVVSVYNEEKKIEDCLISVRKIAEEIIVIDNSSTDRTVEIAKKFTDKIFSRPNNPMLNVNKNFGFTKAGGDWILNLDGDERVTDELADEIHALDGNSDKNGFQIPRKNILFGKWIKHSIWWPDYQLRLFRNGKGSFPEKHVHEYISLEGEPGKLENPILHLNYESVSQFLSKLENIYSESEVENIIKEGRKLHWYDALRMPAHDFFRTYFLKHGYKDGLHGLVLSLLQAFYMLVVFAKVWEREGFEEKEISYEEIEREAKSLGKDFSYWLITAGIDESKSKVKKLALKLRRKQFK